MIGTAWLAEPVDVQYNSGIVQLFLAQEKAAALQLVAKPLLTSGLRLKIIDIRHTYRIPTILLAFVELFDIFLAKGYTSGYVLCKLTLLSQRFT